MDYHGAIVHRLNVSWGICFGKHIVVGVNAAEKVLRHEYGHYLQWCKLGLLYYIVIGIPSLIHAIAWTLAKKKWDYYNFYTEAWANELAGEYFGEPLKF